MPNTKTKKKNYKNLTKLVLKKTGGGQKEMTSVTKGHKIPYAIGDDVLYTDRNGKIHQVTLTMISWEGVDIARGEKPMIAVRMPDGRIRDTVIERISPIDKEISKQKHTKTPTKKKLTRQNALPPNEWYTPPNSKQNHTKTPTKKKLTRQNALPPNEWYTPPNSKHILSNASDIPEQTSPHLTKNLSVNVGHDGETPREVRLITPRSKSPSKKRNSLSPSEPLKLSIHSSKLKTKKRENARKIVKDLREKQKKRENARKIVKELREKQKREISLLKKKKREEAQETVRKLRAKQKKELLKITGI
jgi:hypothetical protein